MAKMKIAWVGVGSAFSPDLGDTSFLVSGTGRSLLLVDCGGYVPALLLKSGRISKVTDVLVTHAHSDHIGGLERLAFYHYFVLWRRGKDLPRLHVATEAMAHRLWEHALKAGMEPCQDENGKAFDATLETYFRVSVSETIAIDGLPKVTFQPTTHVANMENYSLRFENGVYYSGDTTELPPYDPRLIFQDCQFVPYRQGQVHISYNQLRSELPPDVRRKTWLVHLPPQHGEVEPAADGFAGFVRPDQTFEI